LVCANFPGHDGELSQVTVGQDVENCRRFRRKRESPATAAPSPDDESIRYISLGEGKSVIVDAADYEWPNKCKWHALYGGIGYACSETGNKRVLMCRLIMNPPKGMVVDHINGNRWDNHRNDLQICTRARNSRNRRGNRGTSRFKGVFGSTRSQKWIAAIKCGGKTKWLGSFTDEVEAAKAYDRAALKYFGQYACLNFPDPRRIVWLSGRITVHSHAQGRIITV
jgi:hypothetical protein